MQLLRSVLGRRGNGFAKVIAVGNPMETEPPDPPSREELVALVRSFPYWYHRIYLGRGVYTLDDPTHHDGVWNLLRPAFPANLQDASVLDVGANAGFFSILMKLMGAGRVLGIESYDDYLRQAELCRQVWDLDIEYLPLDAHQMGSIEEQFDLVLFLGILYHLKAPLLVLEEAGRVCRDAIVIETEVIPVNRRNRVYVRLGPRGQVRPTRCSKGIMKFIEKDELSSDGSNWWVPDTECVLGMLRTAGFEYFSAPVYFTEGRMLLLASKKRDSMLDLRAFD